MNDRKEVTRRIILLIFAAVVLLVLYILRLISLQLINGETFLSQATSTSTYTFDITAARGEIVDCYGRRLATNTTYYNIEVNNLSLGDADLNETLQELCEILQASGETWDDTLYISEPDESGSYTFTDGGSESALLSLSSVKDTLSLQQYATADNVMQALVERYNLQSYSAEWQRILASIRYQMEEAEFSDRNSFTLAENVSDKTVATIKERSLTLSGAEVVETSVRSYTDGTILPHVLGRVGAITAEQWYQTDEDGNITRPLAEAGYAMNDTIGISGLELAFESELRGEDGQMTVTKDSTGVIIDTDVTVEPEPGITVMTTIDSELQQAANAALEETILNLQQTGGVGSGAEANAGAVVVIDVNTGGVLASSTYPSYDQNLYSTNYTEYATDPDTPLFNRALMGLYTPGSTFKPVVGLAAVLSETISINEVVVCNGTYTYYDGYSPTCVQYGHSGRISLVDALKWSCNIYFYDVGRRTGSETYNAMANSLGLGVQTGVEVPESSGKLTTKDDSNYTASLEIQAAIGQGNTIVTPIQLATYAATIATGGVRYETHFLKALVDTNTGEVVEEYEPVVAEYIEDEFGAFDAVEEGMVAAASTLSAFSNYPYTIASKTGSPQRSESYTLNGVTKYYTNSVIIAYAPAEDPEIAVAVVIEYGGGGSKAASVVSAIFNAYFFEQSGTTTPSTEGVLLE